MKDRSFKGIWIPAEIWLNESITVMEKLFLAEIDSLDNENGCFASNAHFADLFDLSKSRVSEIINNLVGKQLISSEIVQKGNVVDKRILRVFGKPKGGIRKTEGGYSEKADGSNTKINNTKSIKPIGESSISRFPEFWDTFADKRGKDAALRVWKRKKLDNKADEVIDGARRYALSRGRDKTYWKQAQGWLNDGRWKDDHVDVAKKGSIASQNYGEIRDL